MSVRLCVFLAVSILIKTFWEWVLIVQHRIAGQQNDNVTERKRTGCRKGIQCACCHCPGLGWKAGPHAQLLFQADTYPCFCSPCGCGFSELHMTTSSKPSLHSLDFRMGSISKVTFSLFYFGWFYCRQYLSAHELMQPAGRCKATWYSGQLPRAHPHSESWDINSETLCAGTYTNLWSHVRAVPFTQSRTPKCYIYVYNSFSLQTLICIFSIRILFCFFLLYLWLPAVPLYFLFLPVLKSFSNLESFEFHSSGDSHVFGCLICTWHMQQPAPPCTRNLRCWILALSPPCHYPRPPR